jgi:hypothetical protein
MIRIIGLHGSDEYMAALAIRDALARLWPGVLSSPRGDDDVLIAANVKLSGYRVSDVDVVVAATFNRKRYFVPSFALRDREGVAVAGSPVRVASIVAAIEVKGQDARGIRFVSGEAYARYNDGWKSATAQNIEQVHAVKQYFSDQHADAWVYRCVILDGVSDLAVDATNPNPATGAVPHGFTGAEFLTALAGVSPLQRWGRDPVVSSAPPERMSRVLASSIFREITPSRLDRLRMDRIAARPDEARRIGELLGTRRVHVRGHGGTGKTVLMLQAAHEAYRQHGRRVLVLTFNKALAADISRSLSLLRVPARSDGGGVEVRRAISFLSSWLRRLGVLVPEAGQGFEQFRLACREALTAFNAGALAVSDVARVLAEDPEKFLFDAILIDEAQDWPQGEADLIARIYGGHRIALADGIDQLVRGAPTDWRRTIPQDSEQHHLSLATCLRMKRNLGRFANDVACEASLNWEVRPNDQAAGGRVIVLTGHYEDYRELQRSLLKDAVAAQNDKVDLLHCVPPSSVFIDDGRKCSMLGKELRAAGHDVWDGVDPTVRNDFPRTVSEFRIVQYESCRGLEGWTVVLDGLDEQLANKELEYRHALATEHDGAWLPAAQRAKHLAWLWCMMPLTRPIDTLVIVLRNPGSECGRMLLKVASRHPDFCEVVSSP